MELESSTGAHSISSMSESKENDDNEYASKVLEACNFELIFEQLLMLNKRGIIISNKDKTIKSSFFLTTLIFTVNFHLVRLLSETLLNAFYVWNL
ncbi:MAG: hypothetical protein ACYCXB_11240 [Candidatus Humimicrobiaceae bacterium]